MFVADRYELRHFANLTQFVLLPPQSLQLAVLGFSSTGAQLALTNPGPAVAFFVRVRLIDGGTGSDVLPAYWSDNFVTVFPEQTIHLSVNVTNAWQKQFQFVLEYLNSSDT